MFVLKKKAGECFFKFKFDQFDGKNNNIWAENLEKIVEEKNVKQPEKSKNTNKYCFKIKKILVPMTLIPLGKGCLTLVNL